VFGLFVTNVTASAELLQQPVSDVHVILPLSVIIFMTMTGTA